MLSVEEATANVVAGLTPLPTQWCPVEACAGRVLGADLRAVRDQPPAAVSAMDGYAVRAADAVVGAVLEVVGQAPAGGPLAPTIQPGQTVRIFTGGRVPDGADAILIQEDATLQAGQVRVDAAVDAGTYVRPAGLDFRAGGVLLQEGSDLHARAVGLAATLGYGHLPVRRRPRVGIAATGDELCRPGAVVGPDQITSSNPVLLAAAVSSFGGEPVDLGIIRDRDDAFDALAESAQGLDLIVTTGGASVGEHDLVRSSLARRGLDLAFWRVAVRPGKPLLFGRLDGVPLLGLPGNPVSGAVCSLLFLRPMLDRMLGRPTRHLATRRFKLARPIAANDVRQTYMRGVVVEDSAEGQLVAAAERQDSSMLATLAAADILIVRPPYDSARDAGDEVDVITLDTVPGF